MDFLTIFLGFLVLCILALYLHLHKNRGYLEASGLPLVKPFLWFGSPPFALHKVTGQLYFRELHKKYGRTFAQYDGIQPTIVTIDPEFLKQILVKQFENFTDTFDLHMSDDLMTMDLAMGDTWRALRKLLSPTFTSGKLKGMLEPMSEIADHTLDYLDEQIKENPVMDVKGILQGFTLDVIARCGFGLHMQTHRKEEQNSQFAIWARDVFASFRCTDWTVSMYFVIIAHFPYLTKFMPIYPESAYKLQKMTMEIMNKRKNEKIYMGGDFIDRLLEHRDNLEAPVTEAMLAAQGIVFLTAGFETTANTMGTMCYNMAKYPEIQEKVYEEITAIVKEHDDKIDHETITDMNYLDSVTRENLRLFPPAIEHDRLCVKDCVVQGVEIKKGWHIRMPILASHMDSEFYPEPNEFRPERFSKDNMDDIPQLTWRPFGGGPRNCIAQRFALTEIKIFMAKLLNKYRIVNTSKTHLVTQPGDIFLYSYPEMIVKFEPRH